MSASDPIAADPIAEYYDRKYREMKAAHAKLEEAIARGASADEISRLREARDNAGNTGD